MSCSILSSAQAPRRRSAKRLGRSFIGIEREQTYADAARARLAAVTPLKSRARRDRSGQAGGSAHSVRRAGRDRADLARHRALRRARAARGRGAGRRHHRLRPARKARSTRSARMCKARSPATAGPSGTTRRTARSSRSTPCARRRGRSSRPRPERLHQRVGEDFAHHARQRRVVQIADMDPAAALGLRRVWRASLRPRPRRDRRKARDENG